MCPPAKTGTSFFFFFKERHKVVLEGSVTNASTPANWLASKIVPELNHLLEPHKEGKRNQGNFFSFSLSTISLFSSSLFPCHCFPYSFFPPYLCLYIPKSLSSYSHFTSSPSFFTRFPPFFFLTLSSSYISLFPSFFHLLVKFIFSLFFTSLLLFQSSAKIAASILLPLFPLNTPYLFPTFCNLFFLPFVFHSLLISYQCLLSYLFLVP